MAYYLVNHRRVAHTIVEDDNTETIRIISARRADSKARKRYEEFNR
jgi:uncharacterized DUF497 family protein